MTRDKTPIIFDPFRLDTINERLWRGAQAISLTPKAFAVLHNLLKHPGRLVTKEELLDAVWPETCVTDAVLKVCIREIRKALGDDPQAPRFIETVHRRGYRFIGKISGQWSVDSGQWSDVRSQKPATSDRRLATNLVGREAELTQLHRWLEKALQGERQVVFITGEPGIGKTTLVEAFLERAAANHDLWIARGQCLEYYGAGEAYLPVLEAFSRLCREPGRERLIALLARHAPTWLAQMSSLISAADREVLQREILGATRERMLREMAEAVEALTAERLLAFVVEDLQWSDYSTLDLISSLAWRREPARLLLIGTYRPVEVIVSGHPLKAVKQELQMHRRCEELPLGFLTEAAVGEYLAARFPGSQLPVELARVIQERTDGNPLFMVSVIDYLVDRRALVQRQERWELTIEPEEIGVGVPEGIRQMIEKQIERLGPEEQRMLEAASVVGVGGAEFSAVAVAAALEADVVQTEEQLEALGRRRQFIRPAGISEFPDGTVSARYQFIHALYQNVLYERIAPGRRVRLHLNTAKRGEEIFGDQIDEIVGEIWMHCERGRDYRRAVQYLVRAAAKDMRRYANREALDYLVRALKLVERLPEAEQAKWRMNIWEQRGLVRRSIGDMKGSAEDFEAWAACARQQGQVEGEAKALLLLCSVLFWIDRERCLATVERVADLSHRVRNDLLRVHIRGYCGHWRLNLRGWRDEDAEDFMDALAAARQANDRKLMSLYVARNVYQRCFQSDYEAACRAAEEGMRLALEVGDAFDYLVGRFFWGWALLHRGRWHEMLQVLGQGCEMAEKNGHHLWAPLFHIELAWLHQQAFDFERARQLCEPALEHARTTPQETGQLLFKGLLVLGLTHLGREQYERAFECFSEIRRQCERPDMVMDWILHMPLHYGLSEYWLAQKDLAQARREAERLCEIAALPGERTYLALGYRALAEIAMAEQHWDQAAADLERALATLEGADAPLAEWRVYATAAQFNEQRRRKADANRCWARSAAVLHRLADSLGDASELRQSLLTHPSIQAIMRRAR